MGVTVLPLRDPGLPEPRQRSYTFQAPPRPAASAFEGMQSTAVEHLRAPIKRPVPSPSPAPAGSSTKAPAAPASPEVVAEAAPRSPSAAEIELPNGRVVRVPPGFSSSDLERVLAIASGDEPSGAPK